MKTRCPAPPERASFSTGIPGVAGSTFAAFALRCSTFVNDNTSGGPEERLGWYVSRVYHPNGADAERQNGVLST